MIKQHETLLDLLNKCEAIMAALNLSLTTLAKEIGEPLQRVSEWVTQRTIEPSGEKTMKLHKWVSRKSDQIAASDDPRLQVRYRSAYREVRRKRGN